MADRICSVDDCTRVVRARGWCVTHYERWRQHGDVTVVLTSWNPPECVADGCERVPKRRGLCTLHYGRWRRHGDVTVFRPDATRECAVSGCPGAHYGKGFCRMHWDRWRKTGDPLQLLPHFSPLAGLYEADNPGWVGDAVGYGGAHDRVKRALGSASNYLCEHCGGRADDWAYDHADPNERVSPKRLVYSTAGARHYLPLCGSCHRRFDAAWAGRVG